MGGYASSQHLSNRRSTMVARLFTKLEWTSSSGSTTTRSNVYRCVPPRVERSIWINGSSWPLESPNVTRALQLSRTDGCVNGSKVIWAKYERKEYSNSIRQCDHSDIYQSSWRSQLRSDRYSKGYLERGIRASDLYFCKTPSGPAELPCRPVIKTIPPIRVAAASQTVSSSRSNLGPTHKRSFCNNEYHSATKVQQQISRPFQFRYRCLSSTRLGYEQQFYKCSLQAHSKNLEHYQALQSRGNYYRSSLASTAIVSNTKKFICSIPNTSPKEHQCYPVHQSNPRAMQKSKVEAICLEDIWKTRFMNLGLSERSVIQFSLQWAASTLCLYNRYINRLQLFCSANHISFPPESSIFGGFFMFVSRWFR